MMQKQIIIQHVPYRPYSVPTTQSMVDTVVSCGDSAITIHGSPDADTIETLCTEYVKYARLRTESEDDGEPAEDPEEN